MHSYLQTKAVSLQLEAKYIRKQERRFMKQAAYARKHGKDRTATWAELNRVGQYVHRMTVVREEARITNIARAFLRGKQYHQVEAFAHKQPDWKRVEELVDSYGERDKPKWNKPMMESFDDWRREAVVYWHERQNEYHAFQALKEKETT